MIAVATKLITAEEFALRPDPVDGSKEELIRGEIVKMPIVQGRHGIVSVNIATLLKIFAKPKRLGWVSVEGGTILERDPDTVLGPDVSFFSAERHPEEPEGYFEIPPDLAVEVRSPSDRPGRLRKKVQKYLDSGVPLVWVVDPEVKTVMVYQGTNRGVEYDENDTLDGGDVLPGFTCKVAEFFGM